MRIKKFLAPTLGEATELMKKELGENAIILSTRKVPKGGVLNVFGRDAVEVVGAVDDAPQAPGSKTQQRPSFSKQLEAYTRKEPAASDDEEHPLESLQRVAENFAKKNQKAETPSTPVPSPAPPPPPTTRELSDLIQFKGEMEEIKENLRSLSDHVRYNKMPLLPQNLQRAYISLVEQDVDEQIAADIVQAAYTKLKPELAEDKSATDKFVVSSIAARLKTAPAVGQARKQRIIALIGPTGVGKTTTIAKLAAIFKLEEKLDVALISADTYRIGAIEQLRTFASIADLPMEVAYKPAEMSALVRQFRAMDVVLIDTVGRNQKMKKELVELSRFIEASQATEVHIVLSAATNRKTLLDIMERFDIAKPSRIIVSKVDEAATFGALLSLQEEHALSISYVTTGQVVPDDLQTADPLKLAMMVYNGAYSYA